jgi:hypothetical protein
MRTLFVGALVATLVGCSCYVSPQTGFEACTSATGDWFACSSKTATSQRTEPEPTSFDVNPVKQGTKSKIAARTEKPPSVRSGDKSRPAIATAKPTATAIRVDSPEVVPARESSDPVLAQAKIKVAAKLEDPASAEFGEMKRAMRTNTLGQSVDTICGNVKGKKASGEGAGDRPFLYLVKDDEAYVVDGLPTSPAATAYRNICNQVQ